MGYGHRMSLYLQHHQFKTKCPAVLMAGNNPSINTNINNIMRTMKKDKHNNFVIPLPAWVSHFVPHIFLTPQHNLVKEGKKYRTIFNAAEWPTVDAIPINFMTSTKEGTEMDCAFGLVLVRQLAHMLSLHIIFPKQDVALHAKDVKSCF